MLRTGPSPGAGRLSLSLSLSQGTEPAQAHSGRGRTSLHPSHRNRRALCLRAASEATQSQSSQEIRALLRGPLGRASLASARPAVGAPELASQTRKGLPPARRNLNWRPLETSPTLSCGDRRKRAPPLGTLQPGVRSQAPFPPLHRVRPKAGEAPSSQVLTCRGAGRGGLVCLPLRGREAACEAFGSGQRGPRPAVPDPGAHSQLEPP